jgi:hypothetical protein
MGMAMRHRSVNTGRSAPQKVQGMLIRSSTKPEHHPDVRRATSVRGLLLLSASSLALALPFPAPAFAQTWTGANSTDWTDAGNWTGGVPTNGAVTINTTSNPAVLGGGRALQPARPAISLLVLRADQAA